MRAVKRKSELGKISKLGLVLILSLFLYNCSWAQTAIGDLKPITKKYVCPPCGCSQDTVLHFGPGLCESCLMPLILVQEGWFQKSRNSLSFLFNNGREYKNYYVRIFYPLIILELFFILLMIIQTGWSKKIVFLSLFLLSFPLYMLKFQLYGTNYALMDAQRVAYLPISLLALSWPAFYFFSRSLVSEEKIKFNSIIIHFLPAILICILFSIFFISYSWSERLLFNGFDSFLHPMEQILFIFGTIFYGKKIQKTGKTKLNAGERNWINQLLIFPRIFTFILLFLILINAIFYNLLASTIDYHLLWVIMAFSIPWFCYQIWSKPREISLKRTKIIKRRVNQNLDEEKKKILAYMEQERPFLDANFKLQQFADAIGLSSKEISEILKYGFKSNFYKFVNQYRIREVQRMFQDPQYEHFTNFAVAEKAGFRSKATFLSYFKEHFGMTPKEFKGRLKEEG